MAMFKIGPCGGAGGDPWEVSLKKLQKIIVCDGYDCITGITIEYIDANSNKKSITRSATQGSPKEVNFADGEILTSVEGTYGLARGNYVITSLSIHTSKTKYGPFGRENGIRFHLPVMGKRVVGIFGRNGDLLDSLGITFQEMTLMNYDGTFMMGPCGGTGGSPWNISLQKVQQITVYNGYDCITGIAIQYIDSYGNQQSITRQGEPGNPGLVNFGNGEVLTSIEGTYGLARNNYVITSLSFRSNKTNYGPFGRQDGIRFYFPLMDRKVVGIYGHSGSLLDSIGISFEQSTSQGSNLEGIGGQYPLDSVGTGYGGIGGQRPQGIANSTDVTFNIGPCGGTGGNPWEISLQKLQKIIVYDGYDCITGIAIQYLDNNGMKQSITRNNVYPSSPKEINFADGEVLTSIEGTYGLARSNYVITSLLIRTNRTNYGPFGRETGIRFHLSSMGKRVAGIYGYNGDLLDSIGITLNEMTSQEGTSITSNFATSKLGPCGGTGGDPWEITMQKLQKIIIYDGSDCITGLAIEYIDTNGNEQFILRNVKPGSPKEINFANGEVLTSIEGTYGAARNNFVITSLLIHTNKTNYGPFGRESGVRFHLPVMDNRVVGIYGHNGHFLDSLGITLEEMPHPGESTDTNLGGIGGQRPQGIGSQNAQGNSEPSYGGIGGQNPLSNA